MPNLRRVLARALSCAALGLAAAGFSTAAQAQAWPTKPIRFIVSIAPGSVTDIIVRQAANELAPRLGQPLVIENRGGAAGILGGQACAAAPGDGYTICTIYHSTMSYNPLLFTRLPYDPDELVPITLLYHLTEGLFVSNDLGVKSVDALRTLATQKPDALNYATLGPGSFPDLFLQWLNNLWGTKIVGIAYKGGGPAAQAVMANEVQMTRFGAGNFYSLVKAGKAQALALSGSKRSPLLPDVPVYGEVGLGGFPAGGWWGLGAPKGTPPEVVARLNAEFAKLFSDPKFVASLQPRFVVPDPMSPEDFAAFLKKDRKAAEYLIKLAKTPTTEYAPAAKSK